MWIRKFFFREERAVDMLWLLGLIFITLKFSAPLSEWLDLSTFDEAGYLYSGRTLHHIKEVLALSGAWSPLYSLWYRFLAIWQPRPIDLHDFNWRILGITLPCMLYLLLRHHNVGPTSAGLAAWFFSVSEADWLNLTRVGAFASMILSLVWLGSRHTSIRALRAWILSILLLGVVSYARPEFFLAGLLTISVAIRWTWQERAWRKILRHPGFWAAILLSAGMGLLWGPAWDPGRTMYAFGQHYAYNRATCLRLPPRGKTWEDEVRLDFGSPTTLTQAFLNNPKAFMEHIKCNLYYTAKLGRIIFRTALPPRASWVAAIWLVLLTMWFVYTQYTSPHARQHCFREWMRGDLGLLWFLILAPLLASLWLIYSRKNHYLQMVAFWLYLPVTACLSPVSERSSWRRAGMVIFVLFLFTPTIAGFFRPRLHPPPLYNRATVTTLESIPWREDLEEIRLNGTRPVAHYWLIYYLSDPRFVEVPYAPEKGFLKYILQHRVDALVVQIPRFHGDESWQDFAAHPETYGYQVRYIIDSRRVLYLREAALAP